MSALAAAELRREYEAGATVQDLMFTHRLSEHLIMQKLKRAGTKMRGRGRRLGVSCPSDGEHFRKLPAKDLEALLAAYDAGISLKLIADRFGISGSRVWTLAQENGRPTMKAKRALEAAKFFAEQKEAA